MLRIIPITYVSVVSALFNHVFQLFQDLPLYKEQLEVTFYAGKFHLSNVTFANH